MKLQKILGAFLIIALTLGLAATAFAYSGLTKNGVTYYDPAKAYNCYTLIDGQSNTVPYLIDMNGNVVKDWSPLLQANGYRGTTRIELQPDGNLITMVSVAQTSQGNKPDIVEWDWEGNIAWSYFASSPSEVPHHYLTRLENGNTVFLISHHIARTDTAALGFQDFSGNEWWPQMRRTGMVIGGDKIIEVNQAGERVWEWAAVDDPWFDVNRFSPFDPMQDWTHGNTCSVIPENQWYDAGDARFKPGNIIFNPRNFDEFVIIDKDTRLVVWSWKSDFQGGLAHPHEPEMIPKGLPGAGNIIVFDNGLGVRDRLHNARSYVLEINPVNKEIVWIYGAINFYGQTGSTQTRLPNGNTFIAESNSGRCFQVTSEGEVVWEYMSPRGEVGRPRPYSYDHSPQLKDLPRSEIAVPIPEGFRPFPRMSVGTASGG